MIVNRVFVQTWEILIFSCIPQQESKHISHFTTFWNPKAKLILIIWQPMGLWYLSPWSIINKLFNVNKDIYYNIQTLIFIELEVRAHHSKLLISVGSRPGIVCMQWNVVFVVYPSGKPQPLVYHIPQEFFNALQNRLSLGSKKRRLPNFTTGGTTYRKRIHVHWCISSNNLIMSYIILCQSQRTFRYSLSCMI